MSAATKTLSRQLEKAPSGGGLTGAASDAANRADSIAPILSAEGVLRHMAKSRRSAGGLTEVFHTRVKDHVSKGEAIERSSLRSPPA